MIIHLTGASSGTPDAKKGLVEVGKPLACEDEACFLISSIDVLADTFQIMASFTPESNVTPLVTTSILIGYKIFLWCCEKFKRIWEVVISQKDDKIFS